MEIIGPVVSGVVFILSIIISFVAFSIKKLFLEKLDFITTQLNHVEGKIDELEDKITEFREEVLRDYVRKEDFKANTTSHEKLWEAVHNAERQITGMEARMEK